MGRRLWVKSGLCSVLVIAVLYHGFVYIDFLRGRVSSSAYYADFLLGGGSATGPDSTKPGSEDAAIGSESVSNVFLVKSLNGGGAVSSPGSSSSSIPTAQNSAGQALGAEAEGLDQTSAGASYDIGYGMLVTEECVAGRTLPAIAKQFATLVGQGVKGKNIHILLTQPTFPGRDTSSGLAQPHNYAVDHLSSNPGTFQGGSGGTNIQNKDAQSSTNERDDKRRRRLSQESSSVALGDEISTSSGRTTRVTRSSQRKLSQKEDRARNPCYTNRFCINNFVRRFPYTLSCWEFGHKLGL